MKNTVLTIMLFVASISAMVAGEKDAERYAVLQEIAARYQQSSYHLKYAVETHYKEEQSGQMIVDTWVKGNRFKMESDLISVYGDEAYTVLVTEETKTIYIYASEKEEVLQELNEAPDFPSFEELETAATSIEFVQLKSGNEQLNVVYPKVAAGSGIEACATEYAPGTKQIERIEFSKVENGISYKEVMTYLAFSTDVSKTKFAKTALLEVSKPDGTLLPQYEPYQVLDLR